ncbi:MAG: hypothetical protein AB1758_28930 [Candidatus Eremiobacterota bacterium]
MITRSLPLRASAVRPCAPADDPPTRVDSFWMGTACTSRFITSLLGGLVGFGAGSHVAVSLLLATAGPIGSGVGVAGVLGGVAGAATGCVLFGLGSDWLGAQGRRWHGGERGEALGRLVGIPASLCVTGNPIVTPLYVGVALAGGAVRALFRRA